MAELIPVPKEVPAFSQTQILDGTEYVLHFEWNMRAGWFMGLADSSDTWIFTPRAMVAGADMLASVRYDARCPPGLLLVLDLQGLEQDPGYLDLVSGGSLTDLQGRVALVYVPEAEVV